ncbi:GNAT family N-acetyltransferase [Bradyrhizobium genosp. L]|uniref:GNAT family N-acetyltransferase n=1 Tax=Bradyrhizobium genosp. L TaxID=83637 RepID=UPI0018A31DC3|nr:GNAT family N-acetyltransferase [Bradyrhizobium genosp. L]QPF86543.1 GNAT family N-acetyltransferase [Bradyrhizobium genosp. L]
MTMLDFAVAARSSAREDTPIVASVANSFEQAGISPEEWDSFVLSVGGRLYSSYDWCRIWWHHYGRGRELRLFVFRKGERLVGLAPMFIERLWLGPVTIRIAKRLSADFVSAVFALPVSPQWAGIIYRQILTNFVDVEQCDAVWFGYLPAGDPTLAALRAVAGHPGGSVALARDMATGVEVSFQLPDRFDTYVAGLEKRARQNYRRQLNLLNKSFTVESCLVSEPDDAAAAFLTFEEAHTEQWLADRRPGYFGDWPGSRAFNRDLVSRLAQTGQVRLMTLNADGRSVASQYALTFGPNCHWRLPARSTEREMGRYGLGVLGLMQLLEQMTGEGIRYVDAGPGRYDYKVQYGGEESDFLSILVKSTRAGSSRRVSLFLALSDLVHLLYYRIWRLKLAPRQPLRYGSLWRTWIRARM